MRTFYFSLAAGVAIAISALNPANAQYGRHYNRDYGRYDRHYSSGRFYTPARRYYSDGYYRPPVYSYHRVYYNHPYVYSRPYVSVAFGGIGYRYYDGYFYRPYGASFQLAFPPFGIRISTLPYGYRRILVGDDPFYYYNGIFYRPYENNYEVVAPPVGAEVAELPDGAKAVVIDGRKYFEFHGTYYKENIHDNGEIWYVITGKDGVLTHPTQSQHGISSSNDHSYLGPQIGTEVNNLPEGYKTIVLNNQKYFVGPDNTYYQEEIKNNQIFYRVVEKPESEMQD